MDLPSNKSSGKGKKRKFNLSSSVSDSVTDAEKALGDAIDKATVKEVAWSKIKPRRFGDVRQEIDAAKVVDYAETICDVGLLSSISISPDHSLVAGKHRLVAFGLAHSLHSEWAELTEKQRAEKAREHFENWGPASGLTRAVLERAAAIDVSKFAEKNNPQGRIPAKVLALDPSDREAILLAEAIENEKRKDFAVRDIQRLKEQFEDLGYTLLKGRPKKGQKSLQLAIARCTGKSQRTVQRFLATPAQEKPAPNPNSNQARRSIEITIERMEHLADLIKSEKAEDPKNLMHILQDAIERAKAVVPVTKK